MELFFRQIKTTMGMENLRCRTHRNGSQRTADAVAYNLIRGLMQEAAAQESTRLVVSFKGLIRATFPTR